MAESFHHLSWLIPIISFSSQRVHKHVCRLNHGPEHLIKTLPRLGSEKRLCVPMTRLEEGLRSWLLHSEKGVQTKSTPRDFCLGFFLSFSPLQAISQVWFFQEFYRAVWSGCSVPWVLPAFGGPFILWMLMDMVTLLLIVLGQKMLM